jgi:hypothetical protein
MLGLHATAFMVYTNHITSKTCADGTGDEK